MIDKSLALWWHMPAGMGRTIRCISPPEEARCAVDAQSHTDEVVASCISDLPCNAILLAGIITFPLTSYRSLQTAGDVCRCFRCSISFLAFTQFKSKPTLLFASFLTCFQNSSRPLLVHTSERLNRDAELFGYSSGTELASCADDELVHGMD